jgi:hypothetical protein
MVRHPQAALDLGPPRRDRRGIACLTQHAGHGALQPDQPSAVSSWFNGNRSSRDRLLEQAFALGTSPATVRSAFWIERQLDETRSQQFRLAGRLD